MRRFVGAFDLGAETGCLWLGKHAVLLAWAGLLLAGFTSPHGSGLATCWLKEATGLPCPGCGLTRSLSCALRGMFVESFHYHPLGLVILVLFLFIAVLSLLPERARGQALRWVEIHKAGLNRLYWLFVVSFIAFGSVRGLLCWTGCLQFD